MSHEILGNRVLTKDVPAWHLLGRTYTNNMSAEDAVKEIGNDIVIDKVPYQIDVPEYGLWNPDDRYVLVRRPTHDDPVPRFFGDVGAQYTVLQNNQIAHLADMLIDGTDKRWKLDTAGVLHEGRTIFFCLKGDQFDIAGDDCGMYFTISDTRNGGSSIDLMVNLVRVVCSNTLTLAQKGKDKVSIRHHSDIFEETSWRVNVIAQLNNAGMSMVNSLRRLKDITISMERLDKILDTLYEKPKQPRTIELKASTMPNLMKRAETAEYAYMRAVEVQARAKDDIKNNFEYLCDGYGNTGWSAYNAITGYLDHQASKDTENGRRVMAERAMFHQPTIELRTKAYHMIVNTK
jgi:phage/plasmid-like protein (TIGR03299 family)